MKKMQRRIIDAPFGKLTLIAEEGVLTAIRFGEEPGAASDEANAVLDCAAQQLEEYFSGRRCAFSIPIEMRGTPFQKKVWQALMEIGYGEAA